MQTQVQVQHVSPTHKHSPPPHNTAPYMTPLTRSNQWNQSRRSISGWSLLCSARLACTHRSQRFTWLKYSHYLDLLVQEGRSVCMVRQSPLRESLKKTISSSSVMPYKRNGVLFFSPCFACLWGPGLFFRQNPLLWIFPISNTEKQNNVMSAVHYQRKKCKHLCVGFVAYKIMKARITINIKK